MKDLRITDADLTDEAIPKILQLKKLTFLALYQTQITSAGLERLRELPELQTLDVSGEMFDRKADFSGFPKLTNITLRTSLPDVALQSLKTIRSLEGLILNGLSPTEADLASLAKLTSVKKLSLGGYGSKYPSGGQTLSPLAGMPNLETVIIFDFPEFNDEALPAIWKIKSLKALSMSGKSQVTAKGLAEFKKLRPEVTITGEGQVSKGPAPAGT